MEVEKHNERYEKGFETYEAEVNFLAAYSFEERKKSLIRYPPNNTSSLRNKRFLNPKSFKQIRKLTPEEVVHPHVPLVLTLQKYLLVNPPVNQGPCGSCYAFAALAAIEGTMAKQSNINKKLSEMAAIKNTNGCNCGYSEWIYDDVIEKEGAVADYLCRYDSSKALKNEYNCNPQTMTKVPGSQIIGYSNCKGQSVSIENCMKFILHNNGPLSAYIDYDNFFDTFHKGIYERPLNRSALLVRHAIAIVGYGEDEGVNYWLLRNSFGTDWGDKGKSRIYF